MGKKDHCTSFPEYWFIWTRSFKIKKVYIGGCCKLHDKACSTHSFFKCLSAKVGFVSALIITTGGGLGCWWKYRKKMIKRV